MMILNKLTQRAQDVLLDLSQNENVVSGYIVDALSASSGIGSILLQALPQLKLDRTRTISINSLVEEAFYQALKMEHAYVGTEHLLLALLKVLSSPDYDTAKVELVKLNVFPNALKNIEKSKKTPMLDSFGININRKLFKEIDRPLLFRDEYKSLISILLQKNNYNALLIGEKGVGKRSMTELLAQSINYLDVPPALIGYQVVEFDLLSFMTNAFNKNSLEFVLGEFVEELKNQGRVILYIKNFQNIFFASSAGFTVPMFYSMFKASLETAQVKFVASMSTSLYDKLIIENEHILDGFSIIEVPEPGEELTKDILKLNSSYLGQFHNVEISQDVTDYVYTRAKEDIKDIKFPQKALDLLDQACSRLIIKKRVIPERYKDLVDKTFFISQAVDKHIEMGDYKAALSSKKRLATLEGVLLKEEKEIFTDKRLKLSKKEVDEALEDFGIEREEKIVTDTIGNLSALSKQVKKRIIGQDEAIDLTVKSLIRARLGLRSKKRPLGNFLFLGPTGVGKTELAKVIADAAFSHKGDSLIRLDMSDFSEKHTVARLVGAPPGYVGYGEGGELTTKIDIQPESVVLFDEIEKAHPDVLNILLQIMDEGELKDAKGNTFDFSKAIIVLTSNLGTDLIHTKDIGFDEKIIDDANLEDRLKANLKKILKPELINRFDELIVFKRLKQEDQLRILDILISDVLQTLKKQKVGLKVSASVKKFILSIGYSQEYGARSLRRTVEKELLDKIAEVLLESRKRPLNLQAKASDGSVIISTCRK